MTCPRCGLPAEVPPTSWRCACGFDLAAFDRDPRARALMVRRQQGVRLVGIGALILFGVTSTLAISAGIPCLLAVAGLQACLGLGLVVAGVRRARDPFEFPTARVRRR